MFYEASITLKTPTKTGYSFAGWTNMGGTLDGSTFTMSEAKDSNVSANWQINQYKYTVNHYLINTDGSTYTLESSEENIVDFGTEVTPGVKTYTGFEKPTVKSLTVGVDESANKIDYYYDVGCENTYISGVSGGTTSNMETVVEVACGSKVSSVPTLHNYECYGTKQIFFGWLTSTRDVFDTNYVVNSDIRVYPELDLPKYLVCRDTDTACEELYYSQYTYCSGCPGCPSSGMYYPSSHTVLRCGGSKKQAMDSPAGSSTPSDYYTNSPGCHVNSGTYGGTLASGTSVPGLYKIGGTIYHYHNTCCDQGGRLSGGRCV